MYSAKVQCHTSIMMTASATVSRVTPPMKAPAPMREKTPGSIHAHGLGGRKTPGGALRAQNLVKEYTSL